MRSCYVLALAALVGLGCGNMNNGDDGGNGNVDMSAGIVDLVGNTQDFVVLDLKPPPDSLHVFWDLWNKLKQGEPMNMVSQTCKEAGATEIKVYIKNPATNAELTSIIACPQDKQNGDGYAKFPDGTAGPFTVCATLPGLANSVSFKVMNVMRTSEPNVTIYSEGCSETKCMCP